MNWLKTFHRQTLGLTTLSVLTLGLCAPHSQIFAQNTVPATPSSALKPSNSQSTQTVTSMRLPVDIPKSSGSFAGSTAISLEPGLDALMRGQEPRTVPELLALERQQIKVAAIVAEVTVNILQGSAQGSGVIVSPDGYILTAAHVAGKPGRDAKINLSDGRVVHGLTLGMNRSVDAGLIQITDNSGTKWPHASLGSSKDLRLGQWVIAAGHPGGLVDQRPPVIRIGRLLNNLPSTLVTDCTLIGGDSGGPLFDLTGKLVGIHSRIGSEFADNMHVPIDMYRESWDRMANSDAWGTLPGYKPVIGIRGYSEGPNAQRATVEQVIQGGPADRAGIETGDIIIRFDGTDVTSFDELIAAVETSLPGDRVTISVLRDDVVVQKRIIVGVQEP